MRSIDTKTLRIPGALGVAVVLGVAGGLVANGPIWMAALAGLVIGAGSAGSLFVYWLLAPRLGRATTLAGLSLLWAAVLVVMSFGIAGGNGGAGQVAAFGLSGALVVWLFAGVCLSSVGTVRFVRGLQARWRNRKNPKTKTLPTPSLLPMAGIAKTKLPHVKPGRVTPKGTQPRRGRGPASRR